jgi:competence protein ComEA
MSAPASRTSIGTPGRIRAAWFGAGVAVSAAGFLGYQLLFAQSSGVRVAPLPRPTPPPVVVQVSGEVRTPGLYHLPTVARVEDAVSAAGGPTEDADVDQINLAARVSDGQRLVVPRKGDGLAAPGASVPLGDAALSPSTNAASPAPARGKRLNLNAASLVELDALPGVGPVTAQKIVDQRQKSRFTTVDQLLELKIVNSATFSRIRDLLTVE